jgi:hypothetical protein
VRNLGSFEEAEGGDCGNSFFGTKGYYVRGKGFFDYEKKPIAVDEPMPENLNKWQRFFGAVRSRKAEDLPVTTVDAHLSCVHCHLGNIAYRIGRSLTFDPQAEMFVGDDEANALVTREYRDGFAVEKLA